MRTGLVTGAVAALVGRAARHPRHRSGRAASHEPVHARGRQRRPVAHQRGALDPAGRRAARRQRPRRDVVQHVRRPVAAGPGRRSSARVSGRGPSVRGRRSAHSVHVEVGGLLPGRVYYYRFRLGSFYSAVGRTRTAPAYDATGGSLAMSFVSCAQLEHGWFTATAGSPRTSPTWCCTSVTTSTSTGPTRTSPRAATCVTTAVRRPSRWPTTASATRSTSTDPDLQAAHAVAPWLVVFDDHEVDDNWADEIPSNAASVPGFVNRRAAAFQAYYENMPLRRASIPGGRDIQIYRRLQWGRLANFHMLDTRQYRSDQACDDGFKDCPAADDPARSLPGDAAGAVARRTASRRAAPRGTSSASRCSSAAATAPPPRTTPCRWTPGTATPRPVRG